jgi:cyclopropane fatty-acyl-phospholipid synthase-like methyltransferase
MKNISLADMGCGNGIIGISLFKNLKNIKSIHFSDISKEAILICKKNVKANKINVSKVDFLKSNVFSNFDEKKFDIIINDISGISEKVAKISPWFKNVPCSSGVDGTDLTLQFLKNYRKFLNKKGMVFFPIISLCNEKKIFNFLKKKKIKYKIISEDIWPLPKEMKRFEKKLDNFKTKKIVFFYKKFDLIIANTKIIMIKN